MGWTVNRRLEEEQYYNGDSDISPTADGPQRGSESTKGVGSIGPGIRIIQPQNEDQVKRISATNAGHMDDLALLQRFGPDLSDCDRPKSLAVPWMTTGNSLQQDPPSPVMSMSPQAAYMSKIIPNAVLPPSIDVVEINRGRSRSLRTVSKSSLLLSSPASSRASSRASSCRTTSSQASSITSASRYNHPSVSDSSCWSNSESSNTLVSDSSTISGHSTPRQKRSREGDVSEKEDRVSVYSSNSKASKCTSNGIVRRKVDVVKNEGQLVRSLSVMKSKKAPPPPSRSYSLHNKMKRRSRDLAEIRVIPGEYSLQRISPLGEENEKMKSGNTVMPCKPIDSPGYNADTSSLDDSTGSGSFSPMKLQALRTDQALKTEGENARDSVQKKEQLQGNKLSKTISPSSGYSSQDATSPLLLKHSQNSSGKHKKSILSKFHKLISGSSSAGSAPTPVTRQALPQSSKTTVGGTSNAVDALGVSPAVRTLRELFNIPPHPKVHAPPPPPPEVWCHSKRSVELLLGPPVPDNLHVIIKKNPKDRRQQRQSPSASTDGSVKSLVAERKQKNLAIIVDSINVGLNGVEREKVQEGVNVEIQKVKNERLTENVNLKETTVTEVSQKARGSDLLNGLLAKAVEKREERLAAAKREEEARKLATESREMNSHENNLATVSTTRVSSSTVPQTHAKKTTEAAVSPESSWPPPPPPMKQAGVGGRDDVDFPLPPPPPFGEVPGSGPTERSSIVTTPSLVIMKVEPQKSSPSPSQTTAPALNIPPPPSYSAPPPPPPVKAASPPVPTVICPPPTQIPPPPLVISPPLPPPPPPEYFYSPPPKMISPTPSTDVTPTPPKVTSSSSSKGLSPSPPKVISQPHLTPSTQVLISTPPPPPTTTSIEICLQPNVISPPPPPPPLPPSKEFPPPPKVIFTTPPPTKEEVVVLKKVPPPEEIPPLSSESITPPSVPEEVPPPSTENVAPPSQSEVSLSSVNENLPPISEETSSSPVKEASPAQPMEPVLHPQPISPPSLKEVPVLPPENISVQPPIEDRPISPNVTVPPPDQEASCPLVTEVSVLPPEEIPEEDSLCSAEENITTPAVEIFVNRFKPPESIPPPPPLSTQLQLSEQNIDISQQNIQPECPTNPSSADRILTPPQGIPPLSHSEVQHQPEDIPTSTDRQLTEISITQATEPNPSPEKSEELVGRPSPSPSLPQNLDSGKDESKNVSVELQNQEPEPVHVPQEGSDPVVISSPPVNNIPEPACSEEQPQARVTMRKELPSVLVLTSSASGEAPQKPIRKSLIMTSPTSTSPPALGPVHLALPKPYSPLAPVTSSATIPSPTQKSPPVTTAPSSMNLQEAIRLRTAARSKENPASCLKLHSPTSPDLRTSPRSPASTASFIFSKSNKRLSSETKPVSEVKTSVPKNLGIVSSTKVGSEEASVKRGAKMPPPVARKPKAKAKENGTSEGTDSTVGQEEQQDVFLGKIFDHLF